METVKIHEAIVTYQRHAASKGPVQLVPDSLPTLVPIWSRPLQLKWHHGPTVDGELADEPGQQTIGQEFPV